MNDNGLRDLYQELILDHGKKPRNFRVIDPADLKALGHNPLCGDKIYVFLKLDGDRVADVSFQGSGCAISQASASLMTQAVKGRTLAEAKALFEKFHALVTGIPESDLPKTEPQVELGKLSAFAGVSEFPNRVKCASLAWHTLKNAIDGHDSASTE
jgi:nitrogen fixation NifU-like protein